MIVRLAVAAALVGSAVGAAVVLADDTAPPPAAAVPAVRTVSSAKEPTPEPLEARNPRVVFEMPDPKGAAPWVVRRFETTFTSRKGKQTPATCHELGRLQDGTFGWVGNDGVFAPTQPGLSLNPSVCPSPGVQDAIEASISRFATVTTPPGGSPQADQSITWGVAQPQIVKITLPGEPPIVPRDGLFLVIGAGSVPAPPIKRTLERADGTRRHIDELEQTHYRGERPAAGTSRLAAIAPDPAGGRPWGLIVSRGERGATCLTAPEQLVGDEYAYIDSRLGLAFASSFGAFSNCTRKPPTRAYPMRLTTLSSSIPASDDRGRIERRTLEGRLVFHGQVHPDVATVTIRTPRDVRTLVPSEGFVLAVYDGQFPGGEVTATAHLRDGKEVTRSLYVG